MPMGAQEKTVMRQVAIPREVYTGSSNQLFDFLAQALVDFIKEQDKVGGHQFLNGPWQLTGLCMPAAATSRRTCSAMSLVTPRTHVCA